MQQLVKWRSAAVAVVRSISRRFGRDDDDGDNVNDKDEHDDEIKEDNEGNILVEEDNDNRERNKKMRGIILQSVGVNVGDLGTFTCEAQNMMAVVQLYQKLAQQRKIQHPKHIAHILLQKQKRQSDNRSATPERIRSTTHALGDRCPIRAPRRIGRAWATICSSTRHGHAGLCAL